MVLAMTRVYAGTGKQRFVEAGAQVSTRLLAINTDRRADSPDVKEAAAEVRQ